MPSPAAAAAGAIWSNAGLGDPLLANGNSNGAAHAKAAVTAANGSILTGRDKYWVAADLKDVHGCDRDGDDDDRSLLFRTFKVKGVLMHTYRLLTLIRLIVIILFFIWRINHKHSDAMWLWWISIVGDVCLGFSWFLNQISKLNPIKCFPEVASLKEQFDLPDGSSNLPGLDVFVTTVDPIDEPILYTVNSILSILATDYPVDKYACYLSDDGGALVHYEAMFEVAKFAALWVPFCRKHCIEPRAPESYFQLKSQVYTGKAPEEFIGDHRRMRREYDEFKVRVDALFNIIHQRSEAYNQMNTKEGDAKATWMADGTHWPGTWIDPTENHRKGQHAAIVKVVLDHPSDGPQLGLPAGFDNPLDFSAVDVRLPMLVYTAREKRSGYDHQKKAGAMNVQLRVSALLSNAPFIINFDGDHYINNSQAFRAAMCFMLDRRDGDNTAFVQFPQRFDDVDPTDRYSNHNRVFFDATLLGLNGLQGPSYIGTGCMFRRVALYGTDPPRWRPEDIKITDEPNKFGKSRPFINSIPAAANQWKSITSVLTPDEGVSTEMMTIMAYAYEDGTEWGKGVGWVYNIATEDVVTGFRLHRHGWRSMYCTMEPDAFRGTAPINLTDRLYQILRWSGGSLEMFFSRNCPLLAGRRLHPMQRLAYVNITAYPVSSLFIMVYDLVPVIWLYSGDFYIQKPFPTYVLYIVVVIAMIEVIGVVEVMWAGISLLDWWRNEQFYMIGSTGVYPTAVLHIALKLIGGEGISFKLTSKPTMAISNEKFAELYDVQWVPLLFPTAVVFAVNVSAIGVAMGKAIVGRWSVRQMGSAALGMLFNVWILLLLYPFALGIIGRWSKIPFVLLIMLVIAFAIIASIYVFFQAMLAGSILLF